jgi:DNA-binding response OmpR family regulator
MADDLPTARVLLVDDTPADCRLYAGFLEARGHAVTVASDGEEAITKALNGNFDVVVLDIRLPKVNGLHVLQRLRSYAATRMLPVITLSAETGDEARAAAVNAGADLALEKPLPPAELESAIRVFVERGKRIRGDTNRQG